MDSEAVAAVKYLDVVVAVTVVVDVAAAATVVVAAAAVGAVVVDKQCPEAFVAWCWVST